MGILSVISNSIDGVAEYTKELEGKKSKQKRAKRKPSNENKSETSKEGPNPITEEIKES